MYVGIKRGHRECGSIHTSKWPSLQTCCWASAAATLSVHVERPALGLSQHQDMQVACQHTYSDVHVRVVCSQHTMLGRLLAVPAALVCVLERWLENELFPGGAATALLQCRLLSRGSCFCMVFLNAPPQSCLCVFGSAGSAVPVGCAAI